MLTLLLAPLMAHADPGYGIRCADIACASCAPAPIASVDAESSLPGAYGPELAFDGDLSTAWCEGVPGTGLHQSINVTLSEPREVEAILIHGGYFKSPSLLAANGRLQAVSVVAGDAEGPQFRADVSLQDPATPAPDPCAPGSGAMDAAEWYTAARDGQGAMVWRNDGDGQTVTSINITVAGVYPGSRYEDTCISEIQIITRP